MERSSNPASDDTVDPRPLLRNASPNRDDERSRRPSRRPSLRGAARFLRQASSRRIMREPSMLVRETAAEQLEERQSDWAYSRPVVVLDLLWNLAFVVVAATVLVSSRDEDPSMPLRLWVVGYALQCLLHMVCVCVEYRRRHHQVQGELMENGNGSRSGRSSSSSSQQDVEEDGVYDAEQTQDEERTSVAKHLESANIEVELEPSPVVNGEAMTEAAACVKVLIASGSPSESCPSNRAIVEAPLTINIPNGQSSRNPSENPQQPRSAQGTNITIPVSVQKQPLPSVPSLEGLEGNGSSSGNLPPRKRRKRWTPEEDMELIAAVQKCGEGNWANILKGDFKHDRTASQLSQRWAIIRKNKANLTPSIVSNSTGGALTEAQLAARQAVSMALNMPMKGNLLATSAVAAANLSSTNGNSSTAPAATSDASLLCTPLSEASTKAPITSSPQILQQCQQAPSQTPLPKVASSSNPAPPKPRPASKRLSAPAKNLPTGPNSLIQAAAVAAGARIATPSTAASLFKAAQSRNAVHIRQGGSVPQSSMPVARPLGTNTMTSLPPNVHYIRTSLMPHPSTYSGTMPSGPRPNNVQGGSGRSPSMIQSPPMGSSTSSNQQAVSGCKSTSLTCGNSDSKRTSVSTVPAGIAAASEDKNAKEKKLENTGEVLKEQVREQASLTNSKTGGNHSVVDGAGENQNPVLRQTDVAANTSPGENLIEVDKTVDPTNREVGDEQIVGNIRTGENQSVTEKMASSPNNEELVDQIVINKTDENEEKQKVLPISDLEENMSLANAGHENQNAPDNQIGSPNTGEA